jgi:hypothetical protein
VLWPGSKVSLAGALLAATRAATFTATASKVAAVWPESGIRGGTVAKIGAGS